MEIIGSDIDAEVLSLAGYHIRKSGLDDVIRVKNLPVGQMKPEGDFGVLICNPPYGERIGEAIAVEQAYRDLGVLGKKLKTWSASELTSHKGFEQLYGKRADSKR